MDTFAARHSILRGGRDLDISGTVAHRRGRHGVPVAPTSRMMGAPVDLQRTTQ
jgi:hypothetical protein